MVLDQRSFGAPSACPKVQKVTRIETRKSLEYGNCLETGKTTKSAVFFLTVVATLAMELQQPS